MFQGNLIAKLVYLYHNKLIIWDIKRKNYFFLKIIVIKKFIIDK